MVDPSCWVNKRGGESVEAVFPRAARLLYRLLLISRWGAIVSCSGLLFRVVLLSSPIYWFWCPELLVLRLRLRSG
ncbi:hypothetical protein ACOSQ4_031807 [Xanthoceras sorbifolium]